MESQSRPVEIRMVNLQETLDSLDVFRKLTGLRMQDIYNLMLKKGGRSVRAAHGRNARVIRLFHGRQVRALDEFWRQSRPDMVISLIPTSTGRWAKACGARCRGFRSPPF